MNEAFPAMHFHHDHVELLVAGRSFIKPDTHEFLMANYQAVRYRDAIQLNLHEGEVWLFDYGVMVCWGLSENDKQKILNMLHPYIEAPTTHKVSEEYLFEVESGSPLRIHNDKVTLPNDHYMQRLAVSHALAQSAKLGVFEDRAQSIIADHNILAQTLAKTGRIPLSRRELAKQRGALFQARSDILLNFNLLDTPEFFWDYPELEPSYLTVAKYLDLIPRIELLSRKLETIHELVDILASEQNHKHSSFLEWIIILLIAVEIVLFLPKELL